MAGEKDGEDSASLGRDGNVSRRSRRAKWWQRIPRWGWSMPALAVVSIVLIAMQHDVFRRCYGAEYYNPVFAAFMAVPCSFVMVGHGAFQSILFATLWVPVFVIWWLARHLDRMEEREAAARTKERAARLRGGQGEG
jgi:hypothetical protein